METTTSTKFTDYAYERPDIDALESAFKLALEDFNAAQNIEAQKTVIEHIYNLRSDFQTMVNIGQIRHTLDTRDTFYEAENNFFDENSPRFTQLISQFYAALLKSDFLAELKQEFGTQLFDIAELSLKTFKPEIMADLQEENQLSTAYNKLKATASIKLDGDVYNLSTIVTKEQDSNRDTRARAAAAKWDWMAENSAELDDIFDNLVKVRHRIAKKLGFDNFVQLGYARMLRTDYSAKDVAGFREQVREFIVPITTKLYERQAKRIGLEKLLFHDESFQFKEGNPRPQGEPEWIIDQASKMYAELSPETDTFFQFMRENGLMDLVARDGKFTGGYCTYIPGTKSPFIFSNFNGTSGDIDVLTHEAGHAFQVYSSRDIPIDEYNWPTYEACEIHSMSMEFFTWPWMEHFFKNDVDRYRFLHLASGLTFLPYGVAVDEFQHFVYDNPEITPAERNTAWRNIERKYMPHRDYAGNTYLEAGGWWQKQSHIYSVPFYYIDYTLAQICAFQFWIKDRQDHKQAWGDYVRLCKAGGSKSFLKLVDLADLESPFSPGCLERISKVVADWLEEQDF